MALERTKWCKCALLVKVRFFQFVSRGGEALNLAVTKDWVLRWLQRRGRTITRMPLAKYFDDFAVDLVLDVGANEGQYGRYIRRLGYVGRIISFEPQSEAFSRLSQRASKDRNWSAKKYGLGNEAKSMVLNIAGSGPSSSILRASAEAIRDFSLLKAVGTEVIEVKRLDDVSEELLANSSRAFLKIDTQGFERNVLDGSLLTMPRIVGLQLEVSLVPQYESECVIEEMLAYCRKLGFAPYWLVHGYLVPERLQLMQVDLILFRHHTRWPLRAEREVPR